MDDHIIAGRLAALRRAAGLSQNDLANRAGVKIATLQKLESGVNRVMGAKLETVLALTRALDTTIEALTEGIQ